MISGECILAVNIYAHNTKALNSLISLRINCGSRIMAEMHADIFCVHRKNENGSESEIGKIGFIRIPNSRIIEQIDLEGRWAAWNEQWLKLLIFRLDFWIQNTKNWFIAQEFDSINWELNVVWRLMGTKLTHRYSSYDFLSLFLLSLLLSSIVLINLLTTNRLTVYTSHNTRQGIWHMHATIENIVLYKSYN